jgi:hypothetical protein
MSAIRFPPGYLEIHPFQDGNGRLSRVLTTLLLLRAGYAYVPYSSLESVIEQSKEGYYLALRRTQGTIRTAAPAWTPWLTFFLKALQRQMRRLREKVERERLLLARVPDLSLRLLDQARDHGFLCGRQKSRKLWSIHSIRPGHCLAERLRHASARPSSPLARGD